MEAFETGVGGEILASSWLQGKRTWGITQALLQQRPLKTRSENRHFTIDGPCARAALAQRVWSQDFKNFPLAWELGLIDKMGPLFINTTWLGLWLCHDRTAVS